MIDFEKWKRENRPDQYLRDANEALARARRILEKGRKLIERRNFRVKK